MIYGLAGNNLQDLANPVGFCDVGYCAGKVGQPSSCARREIENAFRFVE